MPFGEDGSISEIQWLIEERKRRIDDIKEQLASVTDGGLAAGMKGMLETLSNEVAELERELDEKRSDNGHLQDELQDLDRKLADIDSAMSVESDPIVRNNLEVSKRYLQMERNSILITMTQKQKRVDPAEKKIQDLEELNREQTATIENLRRELTEARSVAGTEIMASMEIRNLKAENEQLRKQLDIMHTNVKELTMHCRSSDEQVLILQTKVLELKKQLEDRE